VALVSKRTIARAVGIHTSPSSQAVFYRGVLKKNSMGVNQASTSNIQIKLAYCYF